MAITINLRYEGRDATGHRIEMKGFGQSLIGLDTALSVGLVALAERRFPAPRERLPLIVLVAPPEAGCVIVTAFIEGAKGMLPFVATVLSDSGSALAWHFLSAIVQTFGGKPKQAESHVSDILGLMDRVTDDRQDERRFILDLVDRLQPSAKQIIQPVGRSCETLKLEAPTGESTEIDVPHGGSHAL